VTLAIVFGANGFIGRYVAEALAANPEIEVVGAGLGTPLPSLQHGWLDVDLLAGDGRLETELRSANPGLVVNCTGATTGTASELTRLNVLTTSALLDGIVASGIRARSVHLGSAAEYGPGIVGLRVSESACARPVSPYGVVKLAATQLVAAAAAAGQDAIALRVFNALGPGMPYSTLPGGALRRLKDAVAASAPRVEMGPLGSVRDFVDVRDIAGAVLAACRAESLGVPIVNVGTGAGHSALELVRAMAERVGFSGEIGEAGAGSPRSSDVPWQVAEVSLAERLLGWRAVHDLQSAVDLMTSGTD
jgi:NDP-hexose 4-ketoreductase